MTSTLHIVNAQYPTQDGVYICTGTSTISGSARTDSDIITVLVLGKRIVYIHILIDLHNTLNSRDMLDILFRFPLV